jgi:AcrR family transcriptional regulator
VAEAPASRLPRGRHRLSRAEVEASQRDRILVAMAKAMSEDGYVGTSVADVIRRAGVSRETFYQLFSSKLDCFMHAFDVAGDLLVAQLGPSSAPTGDPPDRFERVIGAYLDTLAAEPAFARLFLVEVHAAGPAAMARRAVLQLRLVDALAALLGTQSDSGRFACQVIVSAVSAMVTLPLVDGDLEALRALGPPLVDHVRRSWERGLFE